MLFNYLQLIITMIIIILIIIIISIIINIMSVAGKNPALLHLGEIKPGICQFLVEDGTVLE